MIIPSAFHSGMLILQRALRAHPRTGYGAVYGFLRKRGGQLSPRRVATAAASRRLAAPNLPMMLVT